MLLENDKRVTKGKPFTVRVDFREDGSKIGEILSGVYGIEVLRKRLKVGDYIVDDRIVIERKTTLDFAQSIIDGRLFRQATKIKKSFDTSFLIVEGIDIYNTSINIHPHAIKGALISMVLMWKIPVFFTEDVEETALLLWLIGSQSVAATDELSYRPGRRPKRFHKKQLYVLQGLPQIGPKSAFQLLKHFGSLEKVFTASSEELMNVPGLGKEKAKKIREVVTKEVDKGA